MRNSCVPPWFQATGKLRFFWFHFHETRNLWTKIDREIEHFEWDPRFFYFTRVPHPWLFFDGKYFRGGNLDFFRFSLFCDVFSSFIFLGQNRVRFHSVSSQICHLFLSKNTRFWSIFVKKGGFRLSWAPAKSKEPPERRRHQGGQGPSWGTIFQKKMLSSHVITFCK